MHKIWHYVDVRRALVGLHVFLAVLAFTIHFILLSTEKYNWLGGVGG
ncbi:light-harvesting antenna LH1, alpha subunit [Erythrobacter sp. JK5]|nr:light-harvesting antenna LH1, alpha subunit [Erythrobacter sp. JK5]QUL38039.1 light-harvesting protein [Erythrobacter sp. JK5]